MQFCRYQHGNEAGAGVIEGDAVKPVTGDIVGEHTVGSEAIPLADVKLLAPYFGRTILAAAVNYQSHVPSGKSVLKDDDAPQVPQLFLKPSSSVIGPEDTIILPAGAPRVDAEGEVVAVIGKTCRKVSEAEALDYVFGYTCGNDVSGRHWQRDDIQWWRAKGSDTFTALGPCIATGLDAGAIALRTRLNGEEVQAGSTADLIHGIAKMVSFASQVMTLAPGDLLFTGTPGVPPKLNDGDVVEVEIDGVGTLRNSVRREEE